jgi:amidase
VTVEVGEQLVVHTLHHLARYKRHLTEDDLIAALPLDRVNPLTGPIGVRGAKPGDAVVLEIQEIVVGSQGDSPLIPNVGLMQEHLRAPYMRILEVVNEEVLFAEHIRFPVRPVLGDFGCCPTEPTLTVEPGVHGGNIDDINVTSGARIYLPVYIDEACIAIGDVHATQGDTEWCGPLEVDAKVTIRVVDLLRARNLESAWAETESLWVTYGISHDLYDAIEQAAYGMARFVSAGLDLSIEDAALLLSNVAHVRLCQSVKAPFPAVARAEFPKSVDRDGRLKL